MHIQRISCKNQLDSNRSKEQNKMFGRSNIGNIGGLNTGLNSSTSVNNHGAMKPIPKKQSPTGVSSVRKSSSVRLSDQRRLDEVRSLSKHTPPIQEPSSSPPFDAAVITALDVLLESHFNGRLSRDLAGDLGTANRDVGNEEEVNVQEEQEELFDILASDTPQGTSVAAEANSLNVSRNNSSRVSSELNDSIDPETDSMKNTIVMLQDQVIQLRLQLASVEQQRVEEEQLSQGLATRLQTALSLAEAARVEGARGENGRVFYEVQLRELDKAYQDSCSQVLSFQEETVSLKLVNAKIRSELQTSHSKFVTLEEQLAEEHKKGGVRDRVLELEQSILDLQAEMKERKTLAEVEINNLQQYVSDAAAERGELEERNTALSVLLEDTKVALLDSQNSAAVFGTKLAELQEDLRLGQLKHKDAEQQHALFVESSEKQTRAFEEMLSNERSLREKATKAQLVVEALLASERIDASLQLKSECEKLVTSHREVICAEQQQVTRLQEELAATSLGLHEVREALSLSRASEEKLLKIHKQQLENMKLEHTDANNKFKLQQKQAQCTLDTSITKYKVLLEQMQSKHESEIDALTSKIESLELTITERGVRVLQEREQDVLTAIASTRSEVLLEQEVVRNQLEDQHRSITIDLARKHEDAFNLIAARAEAAEVRVKELENLTDSLSSELDREQVARKDESDKASQAFHDSEVSLNQLRSDLKDQLVRAEEASAAIAILQESKIASEASAASALQQVRSELEEELATSARTKAEHMSAQAETLLKATSAYEKALLQQEEHMYALRQSAEEAAVSKHVRIIENLSVMHTQELLRRDTLQKASEAAYEKAVLDAHNAAAASERDLEETRALLQSSRRENDASIKQLQHQQVQWQDEHKLATAASLATEIGQLKTQHEQEVKALREDLRVANESVKAKKSKIQWHIDDHELEIARLAEEADIAAKAALAKSASELSETRALYARDIEELHEQLEQVKSSLKSAAAAHEVRVQSLVGDHIQSNLTKQEQHEVELAKIHARLTATEERHNATRKRLEAEAESEKMRSDKLIDSLHAEHAAELVMRIDTQTKAVQARETALTKAREGAALDRQALENEIQRLQGELADSEQRRRTEAQEARRSAEEARKQIRSDSTALIETRRVESARVTATHEAMLREAEKRHDAALQDVRDAFARTQETHNAQSVLALTHAETVRISLEEELMRRIKTLQSENDRLVHANDMTQKSATTLMGKQQELIAELNSVKEQLHTSQELACETHVRMIEAETGRRAVQEEVRSTRVLYSQQVEEYGILQTQLNGTVTKYEEEYAELQRRHKIADSQKVKEYTDLQKRHSAAVANSEMHHKQVDIHTSTILTQIEEIDILKRAASSHDAELMNVRSLLEQQRATYKREMDASQERTVALQRSLDEHVIAHGELLAIAEDEKNGRRVAEIEMLRQRLVTQEDVHVKAIEEHLLVEERLWKDKEALTRAAVDADISLSLARKQAIAAQAEVKETATIHALRGEELAQIRHERAAWANNLRVFESRCLKAEAALKVIEEDAVNIEVKHAAAARPRIEALQRELEEATTALEEARCSADMRLADVHAAAEKTSRSHVQQLAAAERRTADAQLSATLETNRLLAELTVERGLVSSAQEHAGDCMKKLQELQMGHAVLQERLNSIDPLGTNMQRLQNALTASQQALKIEQDEHKANATREMQLQNRLKMEVERLASELESLQSTTNSQQEDCDKEVTHLKSVLEVVQREKLRLSSALYDSEDAYRCLLIALDEQRSARIEQEVLNSKLERQLERIRTKNYLVESAAVYKKSLEEELTHLNPSSNRTFAFTGTQELISPPGSPHETCMASLPSTPVSRTAVDVNEITPLTATTAGSARNTDGASSEQNISDHDRSKRVGMTMSRIIIRSASKPKVLSSADRSRECSSASRAPHISPSSFSSAPRRTFFETESDGDY